MAPPDSCLTQATPERIFSFGIFFLMPFHQSTDREEQPEKHRCLEYSSEATPPPVLLSAKMTAKIPLQNQTSTRMATEPDHPGYAGHQGQSHPPLSAERRFALYNWEDPTIRPSSSRSAHWSIAWSDLMMTMFILFLSLFVYQAAHKDFLGSDTAEVVAGRTVEAIEVQEQGKASFPFKVIKPAAPFITAGTLPKVAPMDLEEVDLDATFSKADIDKTLAELARDIPATAEPIFPPTVSDRSAQSAPSPAIADQDLVQQQPLRIAATQNDNSAINTLFAQSRHTLDTFNLNAFASIELVPDKAVHIVLTGDLLFPTGQADLSQEAIQSLEKIAAVINSTPHRVHVEGHTDNVPIFSERFADNWELSVARANAVASFLIKDMGMNPHQFVVSGYSSYQPVAPNTSERSRAANRRVEIVISRSPVQQDIAILSPSTLSFSAL